jgi:hypothetical protein
LGAGFGGGARLGFGAGAFFGFDGFGGGLGAGFRLGPCLGGSFGGRLFARGPLARSAFLRLCRSLGGSFGSFRFVSLSLRVVLGIDQAERAAPHACLIQAGCMPPLASGFFRSA